MSEYVIYGKNDCSYCVKAKKVLDAIDRTYHYVEVGKDISVEEFKSRLGIDINTRTTVPQIFRKEKLIGTYEKLLETLENESGTTESFG